MDRKFVVFPAVCAIGVLLDQATKYWVRATPSLDFRGYDVISGFFMIVHAENPGAAFGMFGTMDASWRLLLFLGFTVIAVGVIVDLWRRLPKNDWFLSMVLGMILSGALGNGIDRLHKRTVTDFLRFYTDHPDLSKWLEETVGMAEWPSFNVADSALVVGVGLFLVHYLFLEDKIPAEAPKEDAEEESGDVQTDEPPEDPTQEAEI